MSHRRGRVKSVWWLLLPAIVVGAAMLVVVHSKWTYGSAHKGWMRLRTLAMSPSFADLRVVTSGYDCLRQGIDPRLHNPCDPWKRNFNYPRAWFAGKWLGIRQSHTAALGILLLLAFYATSFAILWRPTRPLHALLAGLILVSPPILLMVERGNTDIVIFVLLALALLLSEAAPAGAVAAILVASILKLFPAVCFAALPPRPQRSVHILAGWTIFIAYCVVSYEDLALVAQNTPRVPDWSFGCRVALQRLFPGTFVTKASFIAVGAILFALLSSLALLIRTKLPESWFGGPDDGSPAEAAAFRTGAFVFLAAFFLGNSFDYRLAFLIFSLPLVFRLMESTPAPVRTRGWLLIATILALLWLSRFGKGDIDELFDYTLAMLLLVELNPLAHALRYRPVAMQT